MPHSNTHPTGVKLEAKLKSRLKKLSASKQRSLHWLMKVAIEEYVNREEQVELLKQETMRRWQDEAKQGKVVGHDAVITWLETWGAENEKGRP